MEFQASKVGQYLSAKWSNSFANRVDGIGRRISLPPLGQFMPKVSDTLRQKRPSYGHIFFGLPLTIFIVLSPNGQALALMTLDTNLSVSGTFTDNLFFSPNNEKEDFGTFVSPGLRLTYQNPDIVISGIYSGTAQFFVNNSGANRYAQFSNFNIDLPFLTKRYKRLEVKLIESFNFSPQLQAFSFAGEPGDDPLFNSPLQDGSGLSGLGLSGVGTGSSGVGNGGTGLGSSLTGIGSNILTPTISNQGIFTQRSDAFQNLAGVDLNYSWSARVSSSLGYRNRLTLFTNDQLQDTLIHTVNLGMQYRLTPRTSVQTSYIVSISDFIGSTTNTQQSGSFTTHSGNIGVTHLFSPTFSTAAQVGVAVTNSQLNFVANADLAKQFQRTVLSLRYRQNITSGGGLTSSASLTQSGIFGLSHSITARLSGFVQGGLSRTESLSGTLIDVMTYQVRTGIGLVLLSWLSGSASYSYVLQDSSGSFGNDAQSNQVFLTLTAFSPTPWKILE